MWTRVPTTARARGEVGLLDRDVGEWQSMGYYNGRSNVAATVGGMK